MKQSIYLFLKFNITIICILALLSITNESTYAENINLIDVGEHSTFVLKKDGTVWAWGYRVKLEEVDPNSEFGFSDYSNSGSKFVWVSPKTPTKIDGLKNIAQISVGSNHRLALDSDGSVWSWGLNQYGQIGNDVPYTMVTISGDNHKTWPNVYEPVKVQGIDNVKKVVAGTAYSIALKEDGTVWSWGWNCCGQLGTGNTEQESNVPTKVNGIDNIIDIFAGPTHVLALKGDGSVWSWGYNSYGELGLGHFNMSNTPKKIDSLKNIEKIAISNKSQSGNVLLNLALSSDGTLWFWGNKYSWNFDEPSGMYPTPKKVTGFGGIKPDQVVDMKTDGDLLYLLKKNGSLELLAPFGNSTFDTVKQINKQLKSNIREFAIGDQHFVALLNDGTLWSWGSNEYGQLGINKESKGYQTTPVRIPNFNLLYSIVVNNKIVNFSESPINTNGNILVPFRELFEYLNASVTWDSKTQKITANKENNEIVFYIDSKNAMVNGKEKKINAAPQIINGKTMVPLRFIGESLGAEVNYNSSNGVVTIQE